MKIRYVFIYRQTLILLVFTAILISGCNCNKEPEEIRLYYLGGQSNMDGYGYNEELPAQLNKAFDNVWIFHGNPVGDDEEGGGIGTWNTLRPGHGVGFSTDGKENQYADRFGLELSFAEELSKLYPDEKIAIIKYSRGGTSIDCDASYAGCWEPGFHGKTGKNQYDHFLTTVRNAMAIEDIDGDGRKDLLIPQGIIWMQGESDAAADEESALRYRPNLKMLMELVRAAFHSDDIPIIICKISDSGKGENGKVWDHLEIVQEAQEAFVKEDSFSLIVRDTENYGYSDPWHYDSEGYIDLGKACADRITTFYE
jgi:hypothetical protein